MKLESRFRAAAVLAAIMGMASAAEAQRVQMPVGYRLTWIGARWQADARVIDSRGQPVANAPLTFRVADPTVATVTGRGEVTARKPGNTRLWAISGRDSASALIVVEQWPARFTFSPSVVRFDAHDARQPLRVLASDSAGVPIVGGTSRVGACRSLNDRVASISGGEVVSTGNGSTWIRCSDRGIADSIRVDVQQRAADVDITNKQVFLRQRSPGDTFSVRVRAIDRNSKPVADARPTWASLNPYVVSIDPLTGRARAVGGGETRVIAQVGDVADSVGISVTGPSAMPVAVVASNDSGPKTKASLNAAEVFAYEGDTAYVDIIALDTAGVRVELTTQAFRILDTTIVTPIDASRLLARKQGQTQLIVRYGSLLDTAVINILPRSAASAGTTNDNEARAAAFRPPTIPDSSAQHQQLRTSVDRVIHTDPAQGARRQNLVFVTNAVGSFAEHLVRTGTGAVEDRTGPLYGGAGTVLLYQRLELTGSLRLGTLSSVDTIGENLKVTEFEGSAGVFPVEQLGLRAGLVMRGAKSELATQTAIIPKVSLVSRFRFIGDVFNTYAAFSLLPKAKMNYGTDQVTGLATTETGSLFSRGGEVGIEFRLVRATGLNGALTYVAEQISFDDSPRVESYSAIRLRFGFNFGR